MNRTTSIIYYIVSSLLAVIAILTFVKLPSIIFVGIEDVALSVLFYLLSILGICTFSLSIVDFFLIKLGIYSILYTENNNLKYRIEQLELKTKDLKDDVFDNKIEIKFIKKNS